MIVFDGTYRFPGGREPRKSGGRPKGNAWRIRIIDFSFGHPEVLHLKPMGVVATGEGPSPANCAELLGLRILRDFGLSPENLIWIEAEPGFPDTFRVAVFRPVRRSGRPSGWAIGWRPIRKNERLAVDPFL